MENIDSVACGKALLEILIRNYGDSDTPVNEDHYIIGEYLLEKMLDCHREFVFEEDFENDYGNSILSLFNF